jgi:hypothetical protein
VATATLPRSAGHPFCTRVNALLAEADFDRFAEAECVPYDAETHARSAIAVIPRCVRRPSTVKLEIRTSSTGC